MRDSPTLQAFARSWRSVSGRRKRQNVAISAGRHWADAFVTALPRQTRHHRPKRPCPGFHPKLAGPEDSRRQVRLDDRTPGSERNRIPLDGNHLARSQANATRTACSSAAKAPIAARRARVGGSTSGVSVPPPASPCEPLASSATRFASCARASETILIAARVTRRPQGASDHCAC